MKFFSLMTAYLVSLLVFSHTAFSQETIRLATGEWPPFISKSLKHHGVVMHIIKESFAVEGIVVEYEFFPWGRVEKLVEKGIWDGLAVEPQNPNRLSSDVVAEDRLVFFHLKSLRFHWNTVPDLKAYKIGGVLGNSYGKQITAMEKNGTLYIERVSAEELNFRKLLKQRIDITPVGLAFGCSLLNQNFTSSQKNAITFHPKQLRTSFYRLSLSKTVPGNQVKLERFNRGLRKLKASGKYRRYFEASLNGEYE
ncbi:MAG: hypothetical protein MI802_23440 [Desulfobacterales bacterium]|nr:hypothetical protein [Desulfobacterales bacterium]